MRGQVCTEFLALSLREAGYTVFANADASGTFDVKTAQDANARMRDAGVIVMSQFGVLTDLMRDWRNTPGTAEILPFVHEYVQFIFLTFWCANKWCRYLPAYGFVVKAHGGAVENGTLIDGEAALI